MMVGSDSQDKEPSFPSTTLSDVIVAVPSLGPYIDALHTLQNPQASSSMVPLDPEWSSQPLGDLANLVDAHGGLPNKEGLTSYLPESFGSPPRGRSPCSFYHLNMLGNAVLEARPHGVMPFTPPQDVNPVTFVDNVDDIQILNREAHILDHSFRNVASSRINGLQVADLKDLDILENIGNQYWRQHTGPEPKPWQYKESLERTFPRSC